MEEAGFASCRTATSSMGKYEMLFEKYNLGELLDRLLASGPPDSPGPSGSRDLSAFEGPGRPSVHFSKRLEAALTIDRQYFSDIDSVSFEEVERFAQSLSIRAAEPHPPLSPRLGPQGRTPRRTHARPESPADLQPGDGPVGFRVSVPFAGFYGDSQSLPFTQATPGPPSPNVAARRAPEERGGLGMPRKADNKEEFTPLAHRSQTPEFGAIPLGGLRGRFLNGITPSENMPEEASDGRAANPLEARLRETRGESGTREGGASPRLEAASASHSPLMSPSSLSPPKAGPESSVPGVGTPLKRLRETAMREDGVLSLGSPSLRAGGGKESLQMGGDSTQNSAFRGHPKERLEAALTQKVSPGRDLSGEETEDEEGSPRMSQQLSDALARSLGVLDESPPRLLLADSQLTQTQTQTQKEVTPALRDRQSPLSSHALDREGGPAAAAALLEEGEEGERGAGRSRPLKARQGFQVLTPFRLSPLTKSPDNNFERATASSGIKTGESTGEQQQSQRGDAPLTSHQQYTPQARRVEANETPRPLSSGPLISLEARLSALKSPEESAQITPDSPTLSPRGLSAGPTRDIAVAKSKADLAGNLSAALTLSPPVSQLPSQPLSPPSKGTPTLLTPVMKTDEGRPSAQSPGRVDASPLASPQLSNYSPRRPPKAQAGPSALPPPLLAGPRTPVPVTPDNVPQDSRSVLITPVAEAPPSASVSRCSVGSQTPLWDRPICMKDTQRGGRHRPASSADVSRGRSPLSTTTPPPNAKAKHRPKHESPFLRSSASRRALGLLDYLQPPQGAAAGSEVHSHQGRRHPPSAGSSPVQDVRETPPMGRQPLSSIRSLSRGLSLSTLRSPPESQSRQSLERQLLRSARGGSGGLKGGARGRLGSGFTSEASPVSCRVERGREARTGTPNSRVKQAEGREKPRAQKKSIRGAGSDREGGGTKESQRQERTEEEEVLDGSGLLRSPRDEQDRRGEVWNGLFPFQQHAVLWMLNKEKEGEGGNTNGKGGGRGGGGVLADDAGVCPCESACLSSCLQVLTKASLVSQWKEEARKLGPSLRVHVHAGSSHAKRPGPSQLRQFAVVITSYELLAGREMAASDARDRVALQRVLSPPPSPSWSSVQSGRVDVKREEGVDEGMVCSDLALSDEEKEEEEDDIESVSSGWGERGRGGRREKEKVVDVIEVESDEEEGNDKENDGMKANSTDASLGMNLLDRVARIAPTGKRERGGLGAVAEEGGGWIRALGRGRGREKGETEESFAGHSGVEVVKKKGRRECDTDRVAVLHAVRWSRVVFDEGHTLTRGLGRSRKWKAALSLKCDHRWLLTATPPSPVERPSEVTNALTLLYGPDGLPADGCTDFLGSRAAELKGLSSSDRGHGKMTTQLYTDITLKRSVSDVQRELRLPCVRERVLWVRLCARGRRLYESLLPGSGGGGEGRLWGSREEDEREGQKDTVGRAQQRQLLLRQCCLDFRLLPPSLSVRERAEEEEGEDGRRTEKQKEKERGSKVKAIVEDIVGHLTDTHRETGHDQREEECEREKEKEDKRPRKVLVVSEFPSFLRLVGAELQRHAGFGRLCGGRGPRLPPCPIVRIDGETSMTQRTRRVAAFQRKSGGPRVCLLASRACGQGLNLQAASAVYICEPPMRDSSRTQAIGRARRIGSFHSFVELVDVVVEDSVEEDTFQLCKAKR
uniref:Helicase C-terminal domain-containing protein n=1 Tax=Chromera velia CCMP2878 TaxID=1169474 RepID=A0A0G4FJJ9_9ALVE|eukprot:Cvel_17192.t1-p1 / transcript=Cvel_17192.t1 / gene=Cvel_17192 / organism=Chromera_velia_CCMP2878 / gene_product=hypothetical protein / transcript_product=hypothetical protein / location=Cvel_scaffold1358:30884-41289(+) / protein_length=1684 / sequence_SO=supercontig / SO=protein_coding / is_pseudo=false